eukprot:g30792.t1
MAPAECGRDGEGNSLTETTGLTELISSYLDSFLSPLIQELLTYIWDTTHTLYLFQSFQFPGPQHLIFTMDVQSLYMGIPHMEGLKALCFFLSHRPTQPPSTDTLIRLAELVLTLNNFSFDSSHFLQTKGMAMGTCMGPRCDFLFVGFFHFSTGTIPHLFLCYVDNCNSVASSSREELKQFINFTNAFHHPLKFTWAISDTLLLFLDLFNSISRDQLTTNIYFKPTDSHNHLITTSPLIHAPAKILPHTPNSSSCAASAPRMRWTVHSDSFVSSTLPTNPFTIPSTYPCNRRRCYTSPYTCT